MIKTRTHISTRFACGLLILFGVVGAAGCGAFRLPNDNFENVNVQVIDTGLEQTYSHHEGFWLNNNLLVVNTIQENPKPNLKRPWRAVIFDASARTVTQLVEYGSVFCRDNITGITNILTNPEVENFSKEGIYKYVRLDSDGKISTLTDVPDWDRYCRANVPIPAGRKIYKLRNGDGYIDFGEAGDANSSEFSILYRPNIPPITLPVRGGEVDAPVYIEHRNEYLIGQFKRLSPFYTRPFRYMTPDGNVTEEPFPEYFYEKVGDSGYMRPVKAGMLFSRAGYDQGAPGLFLVKGKKISRIFGGGGDFVSRFALSPNGCKLAFLSFRQGLLTSKKTIKIIDLCEKE